MENHREELKKWTYLDRNRFTNLKERYEIIDTIKTYRDFSDWYQNNYTHYSNLGQTALLTISIEIHKDYAKANIR